MQLRVAAFSHPDYTVGSGLSPDLLALAGSRDPGLSYRRSGIGKPLGVSCVTPGLPHPAPKAHDILSFLLYGKWPLCQTIERKFFVPGPASLANHCP